MPLISDFFFLDFKAVKPPADVGSAGNTGGSGQVRNLGVPWWSLWSPARRGNLEISNK